MALVMFILSNSYLCDCFCDLLLHFRPETEQLVINCKAKGM